MKVRRVLAREVREKIDKNVYVEYEIYPYLGSHLIYRQFVFQQWLL